MRSAGALKSAILRISKHLLDDEDMIYLLSERMDHDKVDTVNAKSEMKDGTIVVVEAHRQS